MGKCSEHNGYSRDIAKHIVIWECLKLDSNCHGENGDSSIGPRGYWFVDYSFSYCTLTPIFSLTSQGNSPAIASMVGEKYSICLHHVVFLSLNPMFLPCWLHSNFLLHLMPWAFHPPHIHRGYIIPKLSGEVSILSG